MKAKNNFKPNWHRWVGLAAAVVGAGLLLGSAATAQTASQITVKTLGGGPVVSGGPSFGFRDGDAIQNSQFNNPYGLAVDSTGALWIADRDNNAIRKLVANRVTTVITNLAKPVSVAVDGQNNLYVLNQGDGSVQKYDRFGFVTFTWGGLFTPVALALDRQTNIVVAEMGGVVKRLFQGLNGSVTMASGLTTLQGVAVLDSGLVAVTESDNNRIRILNPLSGAIVRTIGSGAAGWRDGPSTLAMFNKPYQIAKAPNGSLVVADRGNHRVRLVTTDDTVLTMFGVDPTLWFSDYPGWEDGKGDAAEARDPVGVAVGSDGTIYDTEVYYHLIRSAAGAGIGGTGTGGGPSVDLVLAPAFFPTSGYHPMGTLISVVNPNTNSFFNNRVFYTTDGSEPTTNSLEVILSNNEGVIQWRETARDLTSLKLKAFSGNTGSSTVSGTASPANEIGIQRDIPAGIGATLIVPVIANLIEADVVRSVQFVIEVDPQGNAKPLAFPIRTLPVGTNDFIPVVAASTNEPNTILQTVGKNTLMAVSFVGTNAGFNAKNFGVVTMLSIPIPVDANAGDAYTIKVSQVTGTSDGGGGFVRLTNMPPRTITITTGMSYLVGDSAPTGWYNAELPGTVGTFGDNRLDNRDVNNAFYASLGIRVPYDGSDAFDAMDAFPEDTPFSVGGDFKIRFLDWQTILLRSLGLKTNNFRREWGPGGFRIPTRTTIGQASSPAKSSISTAAPWFRQAMVGTTPLNVNPGATVKMPVWVKVMPGYKVAGMQFNAVITAHNGGVALTDGASFEPAPGMPTPIPSPTSGNTIGLAWNVGSFSPALSSNTVIGYVVFKVPASAPDGSGYRLAFDHADGSPDFQTQYDWETTSASAGVRTTAFMTTSATSDDWKIYFFGNISAASAADNADPDGDGISNLAEYQLGTNPAEFRLRVFSSSEWKSGVTQDSFKLQWFAQNGKTFALEASPSAVSGNWTLLTNLTGNGAVVEFIDTRPREATRFYRVRMVQ